MWIWISFQNFSFLANFRLVNGIFYCICRERVRPCLVGFSFSSVSADPGRRKKIRPEKSCFISIPDGFLLRPLWVFAGSESGFRLGFKTRSSFICTRRPTAAGTSGTFFSFFLVGNPSYRLLYRDVWNFRVWRRFWKVQTLGNKNIRTVFRFNNFIYFPPDILKPLVG